jgi:poly-gamma-glutamate synthesis protein (capsule biosynthesis protein)
MRFFPVLTVAASALWASMLAPPAYAEPAQRSDLITITLAGDVGLNPTNQTVDPKGVHDGGFQTWADTTSLIAAEIDGDLNFMNVETVVTDRNDLAPDLKGQSGPFNFRMHPNGLKHLVSSGFNVLSLANNHSMDYGVRGLEESLKHVGLLEGKGVLAAGGIGLNREAAARPGVMNVKGHTIAFAATGIVTNNLERHRAGSGKPGQNAYRFDDDFALVRKRLTGTDAAFRILSIHYGVEGHVRADGKQIAEWRNTAAAKDGIDLIVGHHAHVVRGVEMHGGSLIFYGLGNFLHHGTANMTGNAICKNYGLFARVHLVKGGDGRLAIQAVEAIPVTDTHRKTRRLMGEAGIAHVHALNYLAATLDDASTGARGLRFSPQKDGSGLYCLPGADGLPGKIGGLCKGYHAPPAIPDGLRSQIAGSCSK